MKYFIILLVILTSCSSDWHLRRAQFKQPNILKQYNDTITLKNVRTDTIHYADTFAVVHTLTERDTILQIRYLKPETRYQTRWKYKTIRDTVRIKERTERIEVRQNNRTERTESRKLWWLWLIIGAFAGIFVYRWVRSFF
jgi:hypothetical protein